MRLPRSWGRRASLAGGVESGSPAIAAQAADPQDSVRIDHVSIHLCFDTLDTLPHDVAMTLTMAWVRTVPALSGADAFSLPEDGSSLSEPRAGPRESREELSPRRELLIASDSRLRAGYAWDAAPKVLRLSRGDSVLAFAGQTDFAYPLMLQAWNAVDSWTPSRDRLQRLAVLKGHLIRVFNGMLTEISDRPKADKRIDPEAVLLLAGFCWHEQRFKIWILYYDQAIHRFTFRPASPWRGKANRGKILAVVGDGVHEAKGRLISILREQRTLTVGGFDLEPLRVLKGMTLDPAFPTIGGPIQLVKVYKNLNSTAFVVPSGDDGQPTLLGRPLLKYEKPDRHPVFQW